MTKIVSEVDCGNAPKKQYVYDFNVAFAKADIEKAMSMLDTGAAWNMIGDKELIGESDIRAFLKSMNQGAATKLSIDDIISHGKTCSVNGTIEYPDSKVAFCDVYTFTGHSKDAKIAELKSYAIEL